MWPVERRRDGMLWLFVGAQCLQAGMRSGDRWDDASLYLDQIACGNRDALIAGLAAYGQAAQQQSAVTGAGRLCVVISDHWLAAAGVPWSAAQLSRGTAARDAREHLHAAGHELEPDDDVRLDDCPAYQPRLALAYPAGVIAAIEGVARELRIDNLRIAGLGSVVAARLSGTRPSPAPAALAVLEPGTEGVRNATLARLNPKSGRAEQLVTRNFRVNADDPWHGLEQVWARLGWGGDAAAGMGCAVVDATLGGEPLRAISQSAHGGWLPVDWLAAAGRSAEPADWLRWLGSRDLPPHGALEMSLVRASSGGFRPVSLASPRPWQVVGATALAAVAAWGGWLAMDHHARLDSARDARTARARATPDQQPLAAASRDRILAVNRVITHLNLPLDAVLVAIQPPKDIHVGLVGLEAAAGGPASEARPALKIVAETPTAADMTRYVSHLAERRPFAHAELARHELGTTPNGVSLYRFTVEVTWRQ